VSEREKITDVIPAKNSPNMRMSSWLHEIRNTVHNVRDRPINVIFSIGILERVVQENLRPLKKNKSVSTEPKEFRKTIATNHRARHDYFVEDTVEAGLILRGSEVKSLRTKSVNFADCYARIYENECWIVGLQLLTYDKASVQLPESDRRRKLLLSRREIDRLRIKTERSGLTLVPLEMYFKGSWAKVLLGVCRGKTHGDKRETLKKADDKRQIDRVMRNIRR
jgi:SsrA-binding protein